MSSSAAISPFMTSAGMLLASQSLHESVRTLSHVRSVIYRTLLIMITPCAIVYYISFSFEELVNFGKHRNPCRVGLYVSPKPLVRPIPLHCLSGHNVERCRQVSFDPTQENVIFFSTRMFIGYGAATSTSDWSPTVRSWHTASLFLLPPGAFFHHHLTNTGYRP